VTERARAADDLLIFISYRREDSAGHAGRLYDDLSRHYSPDQLFFDVDAIPPGVDFAQSIRDAVGRCHALLALIGPRWLEASGGTDGGRRLDDADDYVRIEIETALERGILVVPILLQDAPMPKARMLPKPLRPLSTRNALRMRDTSWRSDLELLTQGLERVAVAASKRAGGESEAFWTSEPADVELPYLGLRAFEEGDARFYFGRESDVAELVARLEEDRFLAVFGPSGSGKSSLVRAGLTHALRNGAIRGSAEWPIELLRPGARPIDALAARIQALQPAASMAGLVDALLADPRTLHLETVRALSGRPSDARYLWIVDQAEELFTLCQDEAQRGAMIANLVHAGTVLGGSADIVLGMRADFFQRCAVYPELAAAISRSQYLVSPMGPDALRRAIEEPAKAVGLVFEPGLVDTIIDDVSAQPGALPLLEHALFELFQRRRGVTLTLEGYRAAGGVEGALAKRAESVYAELDAEEKPLVRRVLLRLTQPGEGTVDTRRRSPLRELPGGPGEVEPIRRVVDELADARLVTLGAVDDAGEPVVEIAHEALIRAWPRVREWIEQDREALRIQRRIGQAAEEWERLGRGDDALLRGVRLAEASDWQSRNPDLLNDSERALIAASVERATADQRSAERRRRFTLLAATALSVFFLALSALAFLAWRSSEDARKIALGRGLVSQAQAPQINFQASLLLALEGRLRTPVDANTFLLGELQGWYPLVETTPAPTDSADTAYAIADDGTRAAFERGGSLIVQDVATGTERTLAAMQQTLRLGFSPAGDRLIVIGARSGSDENVVVWDMATSAPVQVPAAESATSWTFSHDGSAVALYEGDGNGQSVSIWRTDDGSLERDVTVASGRLRSAALDSSASTIALEIATSDGLLAIDLVAVATGATERLSEVPDLYAGEEELGDLPPITFSPSGEFLAGLAASPSGNIVEIWSSGAGANSGGGAGPPSGGGAPPSGPPPLALVAATRQFHAATTVDLPSFAPREFTFSVDGRTLAVAGFSINQVGDTVGCVFVATALPTWSEDAGWDGKPFRTPLGPQVRAVFSPDGRSIVGYNGAFERSIWAFEPVADEARVIDLPPSLEQSPILAADATLETLVVGPGSVLATGPVDARVLPLDRVEAAAIVPDGSVGAIATESAVSVMRLDRDETLWSVDVAGTTDLALSPDASHLAVISLSPSGEHPALTLWDRAGPSAGATLDVADPSVMAFSPGGDRLAVAILTLEGASTIQMWDVAGQTPAAVIGTVPGQVVDVAFEADGATLVTLDVDGRLAAWDVATGVARWIGQTPFVDDGPVGAGLRPIENFRLATGGHELGAIGRALHVWSTASLAVDVERRACTLAGRNLTTEEWAQYLPGEPYHRTCQELP
jgi:WD40 repeat protein